MRSRLDALRGSTFRSLRVPDCRRWFASHGLAMLGYWIQLVGQALLVLRVTDDGTVLGIVAALQFVPTLVLSPWAGVLSDRVPKRALLLGLHVATALLSALLGALVLLGAASVGAVLVLAAASGIAFALDQPARRSFVIELVDLSDAPNAVSLNGAIANAAKLLGPALAAGVAAILGLGWCFLANAGLSLTALALLLPITGTPAAGTPGRTNALVAQGFRYIWATPQVRVPLMVMAPLAVFGFNWNVVIPILATRDLNGGSGTYAFLMAAMGAGSILGTTWLARRPVGGLGSIAPRAAAFGVSLLLLAAAPDAWLSSAAAFAVGATSMVVFNGSVVDIQLGSIPEMRGRTMATLSMVAIGSQALGGPISGWVAEHFGARASLLLGAAACVAVAAALSLATRRREGRREVAFSASRRPVAADPP